MTGLAERPARDGRGAAGPFAVLGLPLSPDLTDGDVRRAFLARVREARAGGGGGEAVVTAAYAALRSGVRRGELLSAAMTERGDPGGPVPGEPRAVLAGTGADAPPPSAAEWAALSGLVAAERAAQGLPAVVEDPVTVARVAALMVAAGRGAGQRGRVAPRAVGAEFSDDGVEGGGPSSWRLAGRRRFMSEREAAAALAAERVAAAGPSRWRRAWARVRYGRPVVLAGRVAAAAGVVVAARLVAPGDPAVPALGVGAVTWLVLAGRLDLAPGLPRGGRDGEG